MRSFAQYVRSPNFDKWVWRGGSEKALEFRARLSRADIRSLRGLQTWVRERYPEIYNQPATILCLSTGREIIAKMWADYLRWAEGA